MMVWAVAICIFGGSQVFMDYCIPLTFKEDAVGLSSAKKIALPHKWLIGKMGIMWFSALEILTAFYCASQL